jgi:single-strand DNA-binding protein
MGRLVSDPELKTTASGVECTNFRIAVDRSYAKKGEERKADFIDIVCWRQTAAFVCRYFSKGSLIALEGELQTRTYQAKDGTNRYVTEVLASNVSFTGERHETNYTHTLDETGSIKVPVTLPSIPDDNEEVPF